MAKRKVKTAAEWLKDEVTIAPDVQYMVVTAMAIEAVTDEDTGEAVDYYYLDTPRIGVEMDTIPRERFKVSDHANSKWIRFWNTYVIASAETADLDVDSFVDILGAVIKIERIEQDGGDFTWRLPTVEHVFYDERDPVFDDAADLDTCWPSYAVARALVEMGNPDAAATELAKVGAKLEDIDATADVTAEAKTSKPTSDDFDTLFATVSGNADFNPAEPNSFTNIMANADKLAQMITREYNDVPDDTAKKLADALLAAK
jgi:hypothetical protein